MGSSVQVDRFSSPLLAAASLFVIGAGTVMSAAAQDGAPSQRSSGSIDEIIVFGDTGSYANSVVTQTMADQQTPLTSNLALIDNLPGVSIQEGDAFGFDDWSTTITVRGFQVSLDEQQVGITIDGMPNGRSNYGGGSKANRFIDTMNSGGVDVSQGTADIGSRSKEALGGTLNFLTDDPLNERRARFSFSIGEFGAERYYARFDTGKIFGGGTRAWFSVSHQEATDWVNQSAENERDHMAGKIVSEIREVRLTAYISYDDVHEDNYQRHFSPEDFAANPESDLLTAEWTGVPWVDQLYRKAWSTLRENFFTYVKADAQLFDGVSVSGGVYYHWNYGRGDWVPPYIVNVTDDGAGAAHSELGGGAPVQGGPNLGLIQYVDGTGVQLSPRPGCVSSILFPYGGAGPEFDPACHPAGVIPLHSFRHTHYGKRRIGFVGDVVWERELGDVVNIVRGGIWYDDSTRKEYRDWHKITDARVGFEFDDTPYWTQYDRRFPQETFKWYLEDTVTIGVITANFGVKQFLADVKRLDLFGDSPDVSVNSDSDVLFSGGLQYETPLEGLTLFGGYAENFKVLSDLLLENTSADFSGVDPETARNIDAGFRFAGDIFTASLTYYDIRFKNRLIFIDNEGVSGPNFLVESNGAIFNAGGIKSSGVEFAGSVFIGDALMLYASYTFTDSKYIGTGDALIDGEIGVTPGNRVVGVPKNMLVLSADWRSGPYRAGLSGKYTGSRFIRFDNSWAADSYWIVDLYFGVSGDAISDTLKGIDASIVVNNLTDEGYLGGIAGEGAWIGAPRAVVFTLTADF